MATNEQMIQALLDGITPMNEMQKYFRILLYGEAGVGKTKSATDLGNSVLYIEADPMGWVTLQNHPENAIKCDLMKYQGLSQLDALSLAFERQEPKVMKYDTICIDTLSAIASLDLDVVYNHRDHREIRDPAFGAPTQPDYGVNTHRVRTTIMRLLDQPINIVITAHVREDTDQSTGVMITRPSFTPQLRKDIERSMTLVGFMTAIEASKPDDPEAVYTRRMQVHPTRNISAKSRIGGLPVILTNPNLRDIVGDWVNRGYNLEDDMVVHPDRLGLKPEPPTTKKNEPTGLEI